jgi:hypothetical protein
MPCDIGYRSVARARIAAPTPQRFEARVAPPAIDADLLAKLGQADPVFCDWLLTLDTGPLLEKALQLAREIVATPSGFELAIRGGRLAARAETRSPAEAAEAQRVISAVAERWQLEVLRIVADLLGFEVAAVVREDGQVGFEGEKAGPGEVRESIRVAVDESGEAQLRFEHYRSPEELEADEDRFTALARLLGLRLSIRSRRRSGRPIPAGAVHRHPGRHRGKS